MYELIINNHSVDFGQDGIAILFQKQRTDYTNPTIVRNSFTKTVVIPGTRWNNELFSSIWKLDRIQWPGSFNASKRTPFTLEKDGFLVEKGYVKLNNIIWNGQFYNYEITLYGELGNLLYGLSYIIDDETEAVTKMTLGDLDFGFDDITINKETILEAWRRLRFDMTASEVYDTINFMVSYEGVPQANGFDAKKVWVSVDRFAAVNWRDEYLFPDEFPGSSLITDPQDSSVKYGPINTAISRMDPQDRYGLMELPREVSYMESRDLRSYLLRPVIKVVMVFDAIDRYLQENYGYSLDITDEFFIQSEFTKSWITLSMLYEIDPDVHSGSVFSKRQLLSNTGSPADYLISFCKIYGIYMDVDYIHKKLVLTRLPRFFNSDDVQDLILDESKEIKVNPLSFDKATYTFDMGEGDGEFYKQYKDKYGVQYGSKRVNTGYRFDASTSPYINNNIFRQAVDSLDQSIYFRYPYTVRNNELIAWPFGLNDDANRPSYKLFQVDYSTYPYRPVANGKVLEGQMWLNETPVGRDQRTYYNYTNSGYQYMNSWWLGLRPGVYQDSFPKVQFHSADNKGIDGKDVLVQYNGFRGSYYGSYWNTSNRSYFTTESYNDWQVDATKVKYIVSDDNNLLRDFLGVSCYFDNPVPAESPGGADYRNFYMVNEIPQFTRCDYYMTRERLGPYPVYQVSSFGSSDIYVSSGSVSTSGYAERYDTVVSSSSGRQYAYFRVANRIENNHKYLCVAAVNTDDAAAILNNNSYVYPELIGATKIGSVDFKNVNGVQLIASLMDSGDSGSSITEFAPLSTYNVSSSVSWSTYYTEVIDLTYLGLEWLGDNIEDIIKYFGFTEKRCGYLWNLDRTLDFSLPMEIYVPATTVRSDLCVYDRYWSKYIEDVYSINTRVLEGSVFIDDLNSSFRRFYLYDDCLWILSKVIDWDLDTKRCRGVFIKVNDKDNYITDNNNIY